MPGQLDLDRLVASTLEDWVNDGDAEDVVFTRTPFLTYTMNKLIERKASGDTFKSQFRTGRNNNFQGYGPYQTWTFQPDRGYARAEWKRKEHVLTASISGQEEQYNTGSETLFDLVEEVTEKATMSLQEDVERMTIRNDGTNPKQAHGLELLVGDASSALQVVGGIDCRDAPWWQSMVKRPGSTWPSIDWENIETAWTYGTGEPTTINPAGDNGTTWQQLTLDLLDEVVDLLNIPLGQGENNRILLTTPQLKRAIIRLMKADGVTILKDTSGTLVGGHDNAIYRNLTIIDSIRVKAGDIYILNDAALKLRVHPTRWMTTRPWISPYDQDAKYMAIYAWCQMYTRDRRCHAKLERVTHKI